MVSLIFNIVTKKIIIVLVFISPLCFYSQSGKILYNVKATEIAKENLKNQNNLDTKLLLNELYGGLDSFKFELEYTDKVSRFKPTGNLGLSSRIVSSGIYYIDRLNGDIYQHRKVSGEMTFIHSKQNKIEWKYIDSTKVIKGYKCYKAEATYSNNTSKFNEGGFVIQAWYTKEIPVNVGVKDFGNLPGLILELKGILFEYTASEIDLEYESTIKMPTINKVIEEEKYNKILKEGLRRQ